MKWTTATALLLTLAAGAVGVAVVATREPKAPEEVLENVRAAMEDDYSFDRTGALRELERLLDDRDAIGDEDVVAELLRARASIYEDLGAYDLARTDLGELLTSHAPDDSSSLGLEIARLLDLENKIGLALDRVKGLTSKDPDFGEAWALEGYLEDRQADRQMAVIRERVGQSLSSDRAALAMELIDELTARDVLDPERDDLRYRLGEAFATGRESDYNDVLEDMREPRRRYARARAAYVRALGTSVSASAVVDLADSLARAGQRDLSVQLLTAARKVPGLDEDPAVATALLEDLVAAGRVQEARTLVRRWNWQLGATPDFYRTAGEILYRAGEYQDLNTIAEGLQRLEGPTGKHWALFFRGVRTISVAQGIGDPQRMRQNLGLAINDLANFANDAATPEPFYGARKLAVFHMAEAQRILGNTSNERRTLRRAVQALPEHSVGAWVRLAETLRVVPEGETPPWGTIEQVLSEAMDLDPSLTGALEPLWLEAGELYLEGRGSSIDALMNQADRAGRYATLQLDAGPSVLTQIARRHLENGRPHEAIQAAEEARADHPRLLPPLDVIIQAELMTPERYEVERDIVERIEAAGVDETVEGFLSELPPGRLEGEWLVRAIRAAPARFGKPAVARWHLRQGDQAAAGRTLQGIDDAAAPTELHLLRAQLLVDEGRWAEALVELDKVPDLGRARGRKDLLRLRALIGAERPAQLAQHVRILSDRLPSTSPDLLEATDRLARAGRLDLALGLVDLMDSEAASRTPAFYARRVMLDLLLAERQGDARCKESILRAEPYLRDGTPELAALLLAVSEREWTALPRLVDRLEETSFAPTAHEAAALALLGERLERGRRAAAAGLAANPRDGRWALIAAAATAMIDADVEVGPWFGPGAAADATRLLRGRSARESKDPRDVLALVIASGREAFLPWAGPRIEAHAADTRSTIWGPLLQLTVASAEGDDARVEALLDQLLRTHPAFGPAHDLAVRRAEAAYPTDPIHPRVVGARARRLDAMGAELIADPVEASIAQAGKLARTARYADAVRQLLPVARGDGPLSTEGRIMLSLFELRAGQPSFAATHLHEAAKKDLGVYREVALDTLVAAIRDALERTERGEPQRGALTPEDARSMLRDLGARYPSDPLIALAQLELLDVAEGERGRRARGVLRELQRVAGSRPLDSLRKGSTRAWIEFLAPVAVELASELLDSELAKDPGDIELLELAGYIAEASGDLEAAERDYRTLLAIEPRASTCYALAELLVRTGGGNDEVRPLLERATALERGASARSLYLLALADLRDTRPRIETNLARRRASLLDLGQRLALERKAGEKARLQGTIANVKAAVARDEAALEALDDAVEGRLQGLWRQRERSADEVDPVDTGLLLADALVRRNGPGDRRAFNELLLELRPLVKDSLYAEQFVEALAGVVRAIPANEP